MKKYSSITRVNSRRISRNKRIIRIVVAGFIIGLLLLLLPRFFGGVAALVLAPVHNTQTWLADSADSLPYFWRDRQLLLDEIRALKNLTPTESGYSLTISRLSAENSELRALLAAGESERIAAGVIGRPHQLPYDSMLIDQGRHDGVVVGAPVYVGVDTIVGVVSNVFAGSSVVTLITSPSFTSTVYIYGPDIYTTAVGQGGGVLRVGVPQGITLSEGDLVVLPALAAGVFGSISVIESLPTQPEQFGFVVPDTALSSLRLVAVGTEAIATTTFTTAAEHVAAIEEDYFRVPVPDDVLIDTETATDTASTTVE